MESGKPYVITIVGAESSGKTTLALELAEYFECDIVPEYAREYLSSIGRPYNEADLITIAIHESERIQSAVSHAASVVSEIGNRNSAALRKHATLETLESEEGLLNFIKSKTQNRKSRIVIVDGGMMTIRMWARIKYKIEIQIVEEALQNDVSDLYILCRPRKEWEPDPLREAPAVLTRAWIYNLYLMELMTLRKEFEIVQVESSSIR